jgi:hypothetical protein
MHKLFNRSPGFLIVMAGLFLVVIIAVAVLL